VEFSRLVATESCDARYCSVRVDPLIISLLPHCAAPRSSVRIRPTGSNAFVIESRLLLYVSRHVRRWSSHLCISPRAIPTTLRSLPTTDSQRRPLTVASADHRTRLGGPEKRSRVSKPTVARCNLLMLRQVPRLDYRCRLFTVSDPSIKVCFLVGCSRLLDMYPQVMPPTDRWSPRSKMLLSARRPCRLPSLASSLWRFQVDRIVQHTYQQNVDPTNNKHNQHRESHRVAVEARNQMLAVPLSTKLLHLVDSHLVAAGSVKCSTVVICNILWKKLLLYHTSQFVFSLRKPDLYLSLFLYKKDDVTMIETA
jgi:hypothetical protein